MSKYADVSAQTRQNLIDAFWEIYCGKRIEKITVREITAKAGYNRGTFYEYFTDVYDVLDQIEQSLLPDLEDIPPMHLEANEAPLPIDSFIKLYSSSSKYYTVLLGDSGDPAFAGKIKNGIKAKLMEQLAVKDIDKLELDYSLELILSAMIGILTYWFRNGENIPKEKVVALMYQLMSGDGFKHLI